MKESLREFGVSKWVIGASLGAMILAGCGEDVSNSSEVVADPRENIAEASEGGVDLETTYFPNGTKLTVVQSRLADTSDIYVYQSCAGPDLLIVSEQDYYKGGAGGVDVVANHSACADGRLTPEDFKAQE